jgi:membrane protein
MGKTRDPTEKMRCILFPWYGQRFGNAQKSPRRGEGCKRNFAPRSFVGFDLSHLGVDEEGLTPCGMRSMVSPHASSDRSAIDPAVDALPDSYRPNQPRGKMPSPQALWGLLKSTCLEWNNDNVPRMGAALAYYTIFSLAPLLIIAISVAGLVFGMQAAKGEITGQIEGFLGRDGAKTVEDLIQSAYRPAHSVIASAIAIAALFVGASGVFFEIEDALNTIWRTTHEPKKPLQQIFKVRLLSIGMVLGVGFLLLVSLLLSAALAGLSKYAGVFLKVPEFVLHVGDILSSLLFMTALFAMIFKLLPSVRIHWSDVWGGAALTSLLFTAGKFVIGFYVGKSISASAYGAAGSLVIVIAWIYYSALLLYFGAEFTRLYAKRFGSQSEA